MVWRGERTTAKKDTTGLIQPCTIVYKRLYTDIVATRKILVYIDCQIFKKIVGSYYSDNTYVVRNINKTPNTMKFLFIVVLTIFSLFKVFATAQFPDKIIYNGKEYALNSNPLEDYFEKNPDKRPKGGIMSTALWRGYVATFQILDGQVYLKDIEIEVRDSTSKGRFKTNWKSVINDVFPNQAQVKVDWLTGLLVIPHGKLVNYVHMGYGSTYEKYILLEIDKGDLIKEKRFKYKDYEKFKDRQFEVFKQTEEYKKLKMDLKKDGMPDEFIDSFLRSFITNYTTKILAD